MRWDELFADLEGQLEAELTAGEREEQVEEERLRLGRLSLRDRISGIAGAAEPHRAVRLVLTNGDLLAVRTRTVGRDWIAGDLAEAADGAQVVLPLAGIAALVPTAAQLEPSLSPPVATSGALTDRLGLAFVLRDLARRRRTVEVRTLSGVLTGTFDRVGRDHADLAVHAADAPRRSSAVQQLRLLPLTQLVVVIVR
ncbi:hypothetical protein [uncultured Amnibacterium sp.]|uniref:hypothetical protein n=1 Tax=uncultured Amnibacterium sp. TaxID=1631851 RepID=UPI0035CA1729